MKQAAAQNQQRLTHNQRGNRSHKDTLQYNKQAHTEQQNGQAGQASGNTSCTLNEYSYAKEMWPMVAVCDGIMDRNTSVCSVYQTQNIKPMIRKPHCAGYSTMDRLSRSNVSFRDDTCIQTTTTSTTLVNEDQHTYGSPDSTGKSYNTKAFKHFEMKTNNTLPKTLNSTKFKNPKGQIPNHGHQVKDNEEVWHRKSSKTEGVAL